MTPPPRFFRAALGSIPGLAFTMGDTWVFCPARSDGLLGGEDHATLVILDRACPTIAACYMQPIMAPRLNALADDAGVV
jgi:hypothetical protein